MTLVPQNYVLIRPVVRQMFTPLRYRPDRLSKLVLGSWSNVRKCLDADGLRVYPEAPPPGREFGALEHTIRSLF